MSLCRHRGRPILHLSSWTATSSLTPSRCWLSPFPLILTLAVPQSLSEELPRSKGNDSICFFTDSHWFYWACRPRLKFNEVLFWNREVIVDISSTVVDESKEIVLLEIDSLSSNATMLRMIYSILLLEIKKHFIHCSSSKSDGGGLSKPRFLRRNVVFPAWNYRTPSLHIIPQCIKHHSICLPLARNWNCAWNWTVGVAHERHEAMPRLRLSLSWRPDLSTSRFRGSSVQRMLHHWWHSFSIRFVIYFVVTSFASVLWCCSHIIHTFSSVVYHLL